LRDCFQRFSLSSNRWRAPGSGRCPPATRVRQLQYAAVEPFRTRPDPELFLATVRTETPALLAVLVAEGLAPLWHAWITTTETPSAVAPTLLADLAQQSRLAAAVYLLHCRTAARVCECLKRAALPHAILKGTALRETLYANPYMRPADDVDVLVQPEHRDAAIRALLHQGLVRGGSDRRTASHEVCLQDGHTMVDLHWHLFRPGRSRIDLAALLLKTARPLGPFSVLSDDANLLIMLVHPAFTNYVNGRTSKLIRVVDLDRMLRTTQPDWDWILPLIGAAGLRTAAWAVLHWQRALMDTPVDPTVLRFLEPGTRQRRYLASWIDHRLTARLDVVPGLVQWAFTLALHERPADVLRVVVQLGKARLEAGRILQHLQQLA
jgi:hypothetical protein